MGERKVINKYYPPDFDPSKLPKKKGPKNQQTKVRVMLPMTVCCTRCKEFIYKGKKFNSRKETVKGEEYLGLKIFRFYIKCTQCAAEITFKTDPKNSDYVCEIGATRNYEPWKETDRIAEEKEEKKKEEEDDAMAKLETKTEMLRNQMDELDRLDELRSINKRQVSFDLEKVLAARQQAYNQQMRDLELQDEEELSQVMFHNSSTFIRRIDDVEEEAKRREVKQEDEVTRLGKRPKEEQAAGSDIKKTIVKKPLKGKKKKKKVIPGLSVALVKEQEEENPLASLGLLGAY